MKTFHSQEPHEPDQGQLLSSLPSVVKKQILDAFGEDVTEEVLAAEETEGNEDLFESFEGMLPKELIHQNVRECASKRKNIKETLYFLLSLIEKRMSTWEIDGNELYREEAIATIDLLSSARFNTELFLGRGNAGHVFIAPGAEGYCIKYIHTQAKQALSIEEEHALLGNVNVIAKKFEALRVPQAHCVAKNIEGKKDFFTMEKVSGLTLEQLVDFPSKRADEYPDFNLEKIISILEDMSTREKLLGDLQTLHQSGIIHGDIHPRNIMLSSAGDFFLIDFGNAIVPVNVKTTATYDTVENVKELDLKTFSNSIDLTVMNLKKQLTK
jgi:serine/threonine protein kinase